MATSRRWTHDPIVSNGMSRTEAARIGGMNRQNLRDWVYRLNERGPDGNWSKGNPPRLSADQEGTWPNSSRSA